MTRTPRTPRQPQSALAVVKEKIHADSYSIRNGIITVRRGFFYRMGGSAEAFEQQVRKAFPQAHVIGSGELWTSFNGNAPLSRSSHWFVHFSLPEFNTRPAGKAQEA